MKELASRVGLALLLALLLALSGCGPILYPAPTSDAPPVVRGAELLRLGGAPGECVALWSPPAPGRSVVVFFHGNATVIGDLGWLADALRSDGHGILFVEYPGYGIASGTPSEASIYGCAAQALDELARLEIDKARTMLVGQSLGSAVAAEMAVRGHGSRLLLISPFSSIADLVDGVIAFGLGGVFVTDRFDTLSKARRIAVPTVVVQGSADWVVPLEMASEVAGRIPGARLEVFEGAGHNDMFVHEDGRLLQLIRALAADEGSDSPGPRMEKRQQHMKSLLASLLLLTAACGQSQTNDAPPQSVSVSIDEVKAALDPKRSELEAVHGKLMKAVEAAKQHPALSKIASPPADASTILATDEEQLPYDQNRLSCGPASGSAGEMFQQMKAPYQVRRVHFETSLKGIETALAAKHALVCRTTRLDPLVIDEKAKSFTGGHFEGECRLFELEGTRYLGGFALAQGMSEKLSYGGYNPTPSTFGGDLSNTVTDALNRAIWGTQVPQKKLAYGCNFPGK